MLSVAQTLGGAWQHFRSGRLQQAEQLYREIIDHDPGQIDAWHLLAMIASQTGRDKLANDCLDTGDAMTPGALRRGSPWKRRRHVVNEDPSPSRRRRPFHHPDRSNVARSSSPHQMRNPTKPDSFSFTALFPRHGQVHFLDENCLEI
jgi:hypothetical protein